MIWKEDHFGSNPAGVPTYMRRERQTGGRERTEQNFSAYDEVVKTYPASLRLISYFRDQIYPYKYKKTPEGIVMVASAIIGLPHFLVFQAPTKQDSPVPNGEIPMEVSGATKIMLGAQIPYDILRHGGIDQKTGREIPEPSRSELTEIEPYVEYVLNNDLLVSQMRPDVACPAVEPQFRQLAKVLFDGPRRNMDAVGELLGLRRDTINRIKKFGIAYDAGQYAYALFHSSLPSEPLLREAWMANNVPFVTKYIWDVNKSQEAMNVALKRRRPVRFTIKDLREEIKGKGER
jgi:hypothetical protein